MAKRRREQKEKEERGWWCKINGNGVEQRDKKKKKGNRLVRYQPKMESKKQTKCPLQSSMEHPVKRKIYVYPQSYMFIQTSSLKQTQKR